MTGPGVYPAPLYPQGQAFIQHFNLGRYWPMLGPQKTLWIPADKIAEPPLETKVTLLELERAPCHLTGYVTSEPGGSTAQQATCAVSFQETAVLNGTINLTACCY